MLTHVEHTSEHSHAGGMEYMALDALDVGAVEEPVALERDGLAAAHVRVPGQAQEAKAGRQAQTRQAGRHNQGNQRSAILQK